MRTQANPLRQVALAALGAAVAGLLTACSTSSYRPALPTAASVAPAPTQSPVDGLWVSPKNVLFRIERGRMYIDDDTVRGLLEDKMVVVRDIVQVAPTRYVCLAASHNGALRRSDFSAGELVVESKTKFRMILHPNPATQLMARVETVFRRVALDNEARFLADYQKGQDASPVLATASVSP